MLLLWTATLKKQDNEELLFFESSLVVDFIDTWIVDFGVTNHVSTI